MCYVVLLTVRMRNFSTHLNAALLLLLVVLTCMPKFLVPISFVSNLLGDNIRGQLKWPHNGNGCLCFSNR